MLRSLIVPVLLICCPPLSQSQLVKFVELQTVFTMPTLCLTLRFWSHPQMLIRHDSVVLSDAWPCVLCEHTQKHSFSLSLSLSLSPLSNFYKFVIYFYIFVCAFVTIHSFSVSYISVHDIKLSLMYYNYILLHNICTCLLLYNTITNN